MAAAPHDPARAHVPVFQPARSGPLKHRYLRPWQLGVGANIALKRSTFLDLGGFDPRLGGGTRQICAEDSNLTYRALRRGVRVQVDAENIVTHWGARPVSDGSSRRLL